VIVVDTSIIVAYMNANDDDHTRVAEWIDQIDDDLVTTPLIVAEADHLVDARGGARALSALRADLASGAYLVEWWSGALPGAIEVAEAYADMRLGLADASLVVLAERLGTLDVGTLDERHFRAIRPRAGGQAFRILPADQ